MLVITNDNSFCSNQLFLVVELSCLTSFVVVFMWRLVSTTVVAIVRHVMIAYPVQNIDLYKISMKNVKAVVVDHMEKTWKNSINKKKKLKMEKIKIAQKWKKIKNSENFQKMKKGTID